MPEHNFPPPWSVEELDSGFVVKDANGQALAYMYFEKEPRRPFRRELLTRDEAQRSPPFLQSCRNCSPSDLEQCSKNRRLISCTTAQPVLSG
jgi:hypothetical protein